MITAMTRVAELLDNPSTTEHEAREPSPGERAEQLAARIKHDARERAAAYLRDTVVPEGGE